MDNIKKLFQKIVNGQSAMKTVLLGEVKKVRKDIKDVEKNLSSEIKENRRRIDKLGNNLAYLEDDAPTIEEFDKLETRVSKVEKKVLQI